jgi:hypothetical protein
VNVAGPLREDHSASSVELAADVADAFGDAVSEASKRPDAKAGRSEDILATFSPW